MRLVRKEYDDVTDISDVGSTLGKILYGGKKPILLNQVLTLIL